MMQAPVRVIVESSSSEFETSYLTLNRPGFLESGTAGGDSAPLCNFPI